MQLYILKVIRLSDEVSFDETHAIVVRANYARQARNLAARRDDEHYIGNNRKDFLDPSKTSCKILTANLTDEPGIIIADTLWS